MRREEIHTLANELLNPTIISKELMMFWENNAVMSKFVDRQYDDKFAVPGDKIGLTF